MAVMVYFAAVAKDAPMLPVWPAQRQAQLDTTVNPSHRQARYCAWRLLEYALREGLGLELRQLGLSLTEGKWTCPECFFSISHSENAVAVAVATEPVGVDIEAVRPLKPSLAEKILSPEELTAFRELSPEGQQACLLERWCKKESMFKWGDGTVYRPKTLLPGAFSRAERVQLAGESYLLSVTCRNPEKAKLQPAEAAY